MKNQRRLEAQLIARCRKRLKELLKDNSLSQLDSQSELLLWLDRDPILRSHFYDLRSLLGRNSGTTLIDSSTLARQLVRGSWARGSKDRLPTPPRPPFNAEYLLYLLLRKVEREVVIGDLIEEYLQILERFNKRRADIWFYKQVAGSLLPLLRRALLKIGALVWLGRILRRLVS